MATQEPSTSHFEDELDSCELDELSNKPSGNEMRPLQLKTPPSIRPTAMVGVEQSEESRELIRRVMEDEGLAEVGAICHLHFAPLMFFGFLESAESVLQHGFTNRSHWRL